MDELRIRGRQGPAVQALRQALAQQLGGDAAAFGALAEGDTLDAACEAAARRWQSGVGLIADGVIGPRCLRLLGLSAATPMALSLSLTTVRPLFPATKPANIDRYLPYVAAALQTLALVDRPMILAALATIRAESEGFVPIAEMPSPLNTLPGQAPFSAYDHRPALGNTQDGDGARFKGRGFVQLTGRANYGRYGARLGVDLLGDPDLANAPEIAALLLAHFLADRAEAMRRALACGDYAAARRLVNGGRHGLPRFRCVFELAGRGAPGQAIERPTGPVAPVAPVAAVAAAAAKKPTPPLTARKDAIDLRDRPYQPPAASLLEAFPRDEDVREWLPRYSGAGLILDQGQEGSCTGFGLACVINYLRWRKAQFPAVLESVSPRMLYNFARRYDEYSGEDYEGSSCRGVLKAWFHRGVCLESDWPYGDPALRPRYGYAQRAAETPLGVYYRVELRSITDLQAAIQDVGAVYASAFTHDGWTSLPAHQGSPSGHAELPLIPFDGRPSQVDGHAFALVGFNRRGFIVQNSWGADWGCGGFAVLDYADWLANGMDAWVAALGVPGVVVGRMLGSAAAGPARAGGADTRLWWDEAQAYRHSVVLGHDGRVDRYLTEDEVSRTLLHQVAGLPDQWFREQGGAGPRRLVIYAHGGLNSEAEGIARARAMGRHFVGNGCYPLFLVWKTGLLETIGNLLEDAWRRTAPAPMAAGVGQWLSERTDLLIEQTLARPLVRPVWSEMKETAAFGFDSGRGGDLLITALRKLADSWGDALEIHLVGHSAGSILLGRLVSAMAARGSAGLLKSAHLYAPACTIAFANRHYAAQPALMKRLYLDLLSDRLERADEVATIYRKSLLYLVCDALEIDLRTPLLGLARVLDPGDGGWDGTSATGDALRAWREAAARAGLDKGKAGSRVGILDEDKVLVCRQPEQRIRATHGSFDNNLAIFTRTLERITGAALAAPVDDLRGF